jgi:hypothetical protein
MLNSVQDTSKPGASLRFEQSTSEPIAVVADKTWWHGHRFRVGGALRAISHALLITSGLGSGALPSGLRVTAGALGLTADSFMTFLGEKRTVDPDGRPHVETRAEKLHAKHIARTYYGILASVGAALVGSGMHKNRVTESIAGLWTLGWASFAALAPEEKNEAPVFDKGKTDAKPYGFADKHTKRNWLVEYKKHPKKLASDMLQFSALFALADGIKNKDAARIVSSVCLGASNFIQREMKDGDFTAQTVGR